MLDAVGRQRYFEDKKTKTLVDGMKDSIIAALKNAPKSDENTEVLKLIVNKQDDEKTYTLLEKLTKALVLVYKAIPKVNLPKIFPVKGEVDIGNIVDTKIQNLSELEKYFRLLDHRIGQLATAISNVPQAKIEIPKFEFPKPVSNPPPDFKPVLEALAELKKAIKPVSFPKTVSIDNFPPQMVPHPVTHISINSLSGFVKTTSATVTSTLTKLPTYGVLSSRRAIIVYNNSSNTIYIGGSDVTVSNGMPVPVSSYSPILDAGINMIIYGIASSGSNDVRVMEISDEISGR